MITRKNFIEVMRGEKTGQVPLLMREGFEYWWEPKGKDAFRAGWMNDPQYRRLIQAVKESDAYILCQDQSFLFNRFMMTSTDRIHTVTRDIDENTKDILGEIHTGKGVLRFRDSVFRNQCTQWIMEVPVTEAAQLEELMDTPFEINEEEVVREAGKIQEQTERLDERVIYQFFVPSPIVTISRCMTFDTFLEMTLTERELILDALEEITARQIKMVDAVAPILPENIVFWMGGSEQCTPPMMDPEAFERFVEPYDSRVVRKIKEYGYAVGCHCHGKVYHALEVMRRIGYDATEPVEPQPQGNVSMKEGFERTKGELTLIGNLEWADLELKTTEEIREKVRELEEVKDQRLIVASSAGPITTVTEKLVENHLAWLDEYQKIFLN
ncbi:MAG: uroporphyrinogen decarboxylase family protein [Ruminococcus sp.]